MTMTLDLNKQELKLWCCAQTFSTNILLEQSMSDNNIW